MSNTETAAAASCASCNSTLIEPGSDLCAACAHAIKAHGATRTDAYMVVECGCVSDERAAEIISEERMDTDAMGAAASLCCEGGRLYDDDASEPADLSSEAAFRAQVIAWRETYA